MGRFVLFGRDVGDTADVLMLPAPFVAAIVPSTPEEENVVNLSNVRLLCGCNIYSQGIVRTNYMSERSPNFSLYPEIVG